MFDILVSAWLIRICECPVFQGSSAAGPCQARSAGRRSGPRTRGRLVIGRIGSEAAGSNPEALLPDTAGRNALQFLVQAFPGEIERVGDRRHRLDADELAAVD